MFYPIEDPITSLPFYCGFEQSEGYCGFRETPSVSPWIRVRSPNSHRNDTTRPTGPVNGSVVGEAQYDLDNTCT